MQCSIAVLTLILATSLQLAPTIDLSDPPVTTTRESIHRASRLTRVLAMSGALVVGIATAGATGAGIGLLVGAGLNPGWGALVGTLIGAGVGGGVAVLMSPLLLWGLGRALGGDGSLGATALGVLLGAGILAAAFTSWAILGPSYSPGTLIALGFCAPAVIAGGPWGFEISDAVVFRPSATGFTVDF